MEGPTPVSALIHAVTMVTAGVFLISRLSYVFESVPQIGFIITVLGAITAFLAGTTGLAQNDLKRVIAYSTCSQLGYMFFVSGISNYHVSFFHLSNHAFFKALLFLGAGSVIHAASDEQDMRKMGGLSDYLVFTSVCMVIGSSALEGFPFSTGFYSKDVILELSNVYYTDGSFFATCLGSFSVALTAFYSTRSFFYTFVEDPLSPKTYLMNSHESKFEMALPLFVLSIGGLIVGFLTKDLIIGLGNYT
jgi:NADH-ubiquinone oxidoreductase chain 5